MCMCACAYTREWLGKCLEVPGVSAEEGVVNRRMDFKQYKPDIKKGTLCA